MLAMEGLPSRDPKVVVKGFFAREKMHFFFVLEAPKGFDGLS